MENKSILKKAKNLGKIILTEKELQTAKFSEGKKVFVFVSNTCFYCSATLDNWNESEKLKNYLSSQDTNLFFIERWTSPELFCSENVHEFPSMKSYKNGELIERRVGRIYADDFIECLKDWYK